MAPTKNPQDDDDLDPSVDESDSEEAPAPKKKKKKKKRSTKATSSKKAKQRDDDDDDLEDEEDVVPSRSSKARTPKVSRVKRTGRTPPRRVVVQKKSNQYYLAFVAAGAVLMAINGIYDVPTIMDVQKGPPSAVWPFWIGIALIIYAFMGIGSQREVNS
jgi:hypothetical protein